MSRITNSILTLTLATAMFTTTTSAQTKVSFTPQKSADKASLANPQKAEAKTKQSVEEAMKDFKSPWALYDASDKLAYGNYVANTGSKPVFKTASPKDAKKVRKAEEQKKWTYTGFNPYAGVAEDGTTVTGGLVNFNLKPFECDTVSSDNGLSPYQYMAKGKLYSFLPIQDAATKNFNKVVRTIYDANTLERLSQKTFDAPGPKDRVPYILSYDDQRDLVYAISIGNECPGDDEEGYYLNVLDTTSCKLQRIGYLGGWQAGRSKGNFNVKGFCATGGNLFIQNKDDSVYICKVDPQTCAVSTLGMTNIPIQYVYGLQPMIYDANKGSLLVNHYDMSNGTVYYEVSPYVKDNTTGLLKTTLVEKLPTGFNQFYKRPEAEPSYFNYTLADINDLSVTMDENGTTAKVSFTVPSKTDKGEDIEFPSWASKNLRCWIYVDNNYTNVSLPSQITYGQKIEFTTELTGGMHVVTVMLYPMFNEIAKLVNGKVVCAGYDAPASVGDPTLTVKDNKATITWKAPTEGRYADFGSKFDATDLTYKVVRNTDGKVITDGITETSASDDIADEIQTYSYTIYAISHGQTSIAISTNKVSGGKYLALPYKNEFDDKNSLIGWTIINANNDGSARTWAWNIYYKLIYDIQGGNDDWLISSSVQLSSDKLYAFSYKAKGYGILLTTVGQGTTVEAQDNEIGSLDNYTTEGDETKEYYFRPSDNGTYNFGIHDYSINGYWYIDDVEIKAIATTNAPDKVRSLSFTPDDKGALGATISFKLPATDIKGYSLSALTKVTVYDMEGNEMGSTTNVAPGADASVKVKAIHGWNDFKIVAANADGEGWPVIIRKYVGADTPKPISNIKVTWGEERTIANLSWDAATEGVNGGYVDPETINYKIYKYDSKSYPSYIEIGETGNETSVEVDIKDATETQDQYVFGITATSENGESDYTKAGIVLGVPYTMPFTEPFSATAGITHSPWIADQGWTLDQGHYNDKVQPQNDDQLQLVFINPGTEDLSGRFTTPIIDFTNAENPVLTAWLHHTEGLSEGTTVTAVATTDGANYITLGDPVSLNGNSGWVEHVFDLSALKGSKAQVALKAYLPNPSGRVFSDNWTIKEATGNDLALAAISQPYYPVVGDNAEIEVTVENKGAKVANNYSVLFYLNGEAIAEQESTEALGIGKQATFNFPLNINSATKEYVYSAEVSYDGDDNTDNNFSTEVELTPEQLILPAPTNLAVTNDNELSWMAPETMDGREITLDFEDVPAFTTDNMKGWTTVDRDGHLTLTFVQYYNNYWPYAHQPLAWMTWSAKEAGCPTATMWQAYEGEKCLIHWGNYGVDAEGRTNNDPDDDWFISPEIKGGTEFSFMTLANEQTNSIEILTSSTDQEPESFTNKVKTVTYDAAGAWQEVKVTLPADAKYVAIHTVLDGFGTMIDNIKYTEAKAPKLLSYNIYCGTENTGSATTTSAKAEGASGNYAVSAVYDLGESELSNAVAVTTGITELNATNAKVYGGEGVISIKATNGADVAIYTIGGQKLASIKAADNETVTVPAGVYVAKVGGKTYKVNVK
ncbi:choice-of-anchor J domain-containing protein [Prevotella sp.]|uniref:choice-of-anchor J domain-containing protein n=1 Tax=Prevotella sp. TaxID=59823 RepID=UPI0025D5DEBD|nr:choice-of-anchor J domain-containing protein [Prevotella sp.]